MDFLNSPDALQLQAWLFQALIFMGLAKPALEWVTKKTKATWDDHLVSNMFAALDIIARYVPRAKVGK